MGDWKPDLRMSVRGAGSQIYFWVIPAQVGGLWKLQVGSARGNQEYELDIAQKYQEINVVGRRAGKQLLVLTPRLDGDAIGFVLVDHDAPAYRRRFDGKVTGNSIEGMARGDTNALPGEFKWRATRAAP
jgi:hypothetical protein